VIMSARQTSNQWPVLADDIFHRMILTDETRQSYSIPALTSAVRPPGVVQMPSNRSSDASSVTATSGIGSTSMLSCWIVQKPVVGDPPGVPEYYRERHKQAETDQWAAGEEGRKIRKRCVTCKKRTVYLCVHCDKFFCKDGMVRFCMWGHICSMFQDSHFAGEEFIQKHAEWRAACI
jgi:hypothetical protein